MDHASLRAEARTVPPRSEQAVEPLPPGTGKVVLIEDRMVVGKIALPLAGSPCAVVESAEQVRDTGQGVVQGYACTEEFSHGRAGDMLGHEDGMEPVVRGDGMGNADPARYTPEP
ncbi:MAG: hypothetical protein BWX50_00412 [Euryarchaeota archaeon ADurb.Bin009]|nr:MAG: hypothetical protein BWX50_00412 [Euryarchaeota archaeon ADurb.Bin009]